MKTIRMSTALCTALLGLCGCGAGLEPGASFDLRSQQVASANGMASNGLSSNGLSSNGMSSNGLSSNGMSSNGLSSNGLSSNGLALASFTSWWASQTESYAAMVMKYVVKCAYPSTPPSTGSTMRSTTLRGAEYLPPGICPLGFLGSEVRIAMDRKQPISVG